MGVALIFLDSWKPVAGILVRAFAEQNSRNKLGKS
jgi:hypothetical protein